MNQFCRSSIGSELRMTSVHAIRLEPMADGAASEQRCAEAALDAGAYCFETSDVARASLVRIRAVRV